MIPLDELAPPHRPTADNPIRMTAPDMGPGLRRSFPVWYEDSGKADTRPLAVLTLLGLLLASLAAFAG